MSSGLRIGRLALPGRVLLAPMAGISDAPFRRLCRVQGAALAATEMASSDRSLWGSRKSRLRLRLDDEPWPRVVQLAGSEPAQLARAAQLAVELGADIIDINMGCPAKKVCRRAAGSALLREPRLVQRILQAVVAAVDVPVTLKMRTGWSPAERNGPQIARIAEDCGVQALAVHGRTRACAFRGHAEYATIHAIKSAVRIPVIANGDINSPAKAIDALEQTGADAVMIGRAARGQPWLFAQVQGVLETGRAPPLPSPAAVRDMIRVHLDAIYRWYGAASGVRVARKHLAWYSEQLALPAEIRQRAVRTETAGEQMQLVESCFARRSNGEDSATAAILPRYWQSGADDNQQKNQYAQETFQNVGEPDQRPQAAVAGLHRRGDQALLPGSERPQAR